MLSGEARDISSHVSNTAHLLDLGPYVRNDIASLRILLVRDPVDIVLSRTLRKPEYRAWLGKATADDVDYLQDNIRVVGRFYEAVRPEGYDLTCRYEDMVADPFPVLERICGLLGTKVDAAALRVVADRGKRKDAPDQDLSEERRARYADRIDDFRQTAATALAGTRAQLGYA
jgi:hypothetical protein